jgi:HK97 family phage major capsid protein
MTIETIKDPSNESYKALEALQGASEAQSKKINEFLDSQESKNQELVAKQAETLKAASELEEKMGSLEAEIKRSPMGSDEAESKKSEMKAFSEFFSKGSVDTKYLRTDINPDGGYLVPVEQDLGLSIKNITEISNVRSLAKVRTMNAKTLRLSTRSSLLTAGWAGEGEVGIDSFSNYGKEELVAKKLQVSCGITIEELQDATPNMISEIGSDVNERFAQVEGASFVNGDGSKKPEGFMFNADITSINSGDASLITFDSLISLTGELKTGYNPVYAFNRRTLADIRKLKDGAGAYIWRAGNLGAGLPNTINGVSYAILEDMPDIAASAFPVIYGDFFRGYLIGDRAGMSVVRDELTLKKEGKVEFTYIKRLDAQVVQPEAFKKLKISV